MIKKRFILVIMIILTFSISLVSANEDLNNGEVQVKNCTTKEEEKIQIEYLIYYLDEKLVDNESCDFDLEKLGQNLATDDCCCDDCCAHHHEGED